MKSLKVFGGASIHEGKNVRTIVAAKTKKRAFELLRQDGRFGCYKYFNDYFGQTGNPKELATANEEGVWVVIDEYSTNPTFKRLR